ncbi:MAG: (deoxy)nucleoside triphosphate pyrophosphohydrolase [bacterium]|nr:(deoxy)nucleoside triphosphate pyrophosphohydrolase [bacterium]
MKTVKVVAAVICDSFKNTTKIFATARGYGEFKGQWEFPGGKVEAGETPQQALIREIQEELDVKIEVGELIGTIEYDYPTFHLSMDCFWCVVIDGKIVLKEAEAARWLNKDELYNVDWLPADIALIEKLQDSLLM